MSHQPLVSVLLPAYNSAAFLGEAIQSILDQTYQNWECILINDGSTDVTEEVILSFTDARIKYIKNERNLGLVATLNKGLDIAAGKYIVRMDGDDISLDNRIERQVAFMEANETIGVADCNYYAFDMADGVMVKGYAEPDVHKGILLFNTSLCHPAVIIRKSVLDEHRLRYNSAYKHLEDYELWTRMCKITEISTVPEFLFRYRSHEQQVSQHQFNYQKEQANELRKIYLTEMGFNLTTEELGYHNLVACNNRINSMEELKGIESWFKKMLEQNKVTQKIKQSALEQVVGKMWWDTCGNTSLGFTALSFYYQSDLRSSYPVTISNSIKLAAKCWLRRNT